jgi:Ni/Co efflux regulator RcnB
MMARIGAVLLAVPLLSAAVANNAVAAAPLQAAAQQQTRDASDLSARRRMRHHHRDASRREYRPDRPYYLDRPSYYAPAPFVPFNFGYGLGPWW